MAKPRIVPVEPPYDEKTEERLRKWMPPASAGLPPLGLFRTLARHPELADRMRPLGALLLGRGTLPPRARELLILRTCARVGAEYEWGVHVTGFAAAVGLDAATVAATSAPAPAIAADDAPILQLADELHDRGQVPDDLWQTLAARWSAEQLLEAVALVGFYHLISFICNAAAVALEPWAARF